MVPSANTVDCHSLQETGLLLLEIFQLAFLGDTPGWRHRDIDRGHIVVLLVWNVRWTYSWTTYVKTIQVHDRNCFQTSLLNESKQSI